MGCKKIGLIAGIAVLFSMCLPMAYATCGDVALVSGYVTDSNTKEGIVWADVDVLCMHNNVTADTLTEVGGSYFVSLCCPDGAQVRVTATKDGEHKGTGYGTVKFINILPETQVNVGIVKTNVSVPEFPTIFIPTMITLMTLGIARRKL